MPIQENTVNQVVLCERCGKPLRIYPSSLRRGERRRFCNRTCQFDWNGTPEERFWRNVQRSPGCWLWTGYIDNLGYGNFRPAKGVRPIRTHRFSYELSVGPITNGLYVCHTCDVRHCVRPEHLFLGTLQENIADMVAKERQHHPDHHGERHPLARLNAEQVLEIRARRSRGEKPEAIARAFGITTNHVSLIFHRRIWKHLP